MDETSSRERVGREAAEWWFRIGMSEPENTPYKDREEFSRWLRQSPVHIAEFLRVAQVHHELGRFRAWSEIDAMDPAAAGNDNIIPLVMVQPGTRADPAPRRRRWLQAGIAAAAAVLVLAAVLTPRLRDTSYQTDRAERHEVALNDGSVVRLEPETKIVVSFGEHERGITLARGRAMFQVAKDPARPFLVRAGGTVVRALGTAFGVEQTTGQLIVTVAEGKVAVSQVRPAAAAATGQDSRDALLIADQQVAVARSGRVTPVRHVDASRALAWAEGRLVFDSTPLAEVVAEFNRYNKVELKVDDPELAQRKVSGVFKANDPETLVAFVEAGARVSVDRESQQVILFRTATQP